MPKVQFYPMDIMYKVVNNEPLILLFGKTTDDKQICIVDSFQPYFWVQLKEENDLEKFSEKLKTLKVDDDHFVVKTELKKRKILGKETQLVKVYTNVPAAVPKVREEIRNKKQVVETYEFDIPFTRRYLIDTGIIPCTLYEVEGETHPLPLKVPAIKAEKIVLEKVISLIRIIL
jgi:DNA polymerase I